MKDRGGPSIFFLTSIRLLKFLVTVKKLPQTFACQVWVTMCFHVVSVRPRVPVWLTDENFRQWGPEKLAWQTEHYRAVSVHHWSDWCLPMWFSEAYACLCQMCTTLASFMSTCHKLDSFGRREARVRKCTHQISPWASLRGIFWIDVGGIYSLRGVPL